jgi:Na+-transporting methylmalonyl-CoA/oxaloacetate decarboxylase gamma subunit
MAPNSTQWLLQLIWLILLAVPIACVAWTVTHEEIFREPRDFCLERSKSGRSLLARKFFYLFTCEYCFSHYVTIFFLILTRYRLLLDDWRGYVIAFFALVAVANVYMSSFARLRQEVKSEKLDAKKKEKELEEGEKGAVIASSVHPLPAVPRPAREEGVLKGL